MADELNNLVEYACSDRIATITLNRPDKLNAVNDDMVRSLAAALQRFDTDDDAWVAILCGRGRAFSSGADVQQRQLRSREEFMRHGGAQAQDASSHELFLRAVNWKPVIAAVHGYALGLGYALVQRADLVVAAEGTKFQIREVQRGLGGTQHWVSTWFWTGSRFANEIALTGRMLTAEEALAQGMINAEVPAEELLPAAERLAAQIMENPPLSVRANVRMIRWFVHELQRQTRLYTQPLALHLTEDFHESAAAFIEKRKPEFKGR